MCRIPQGNLVIARHRQQKQKNNRGISYSVTIVKYNNINYGLHEKLISIIIKLRKGYFIIMDINFS